MLDSSGCLSGGVLGWREEDLRFKLCLIQSAPQADERSRTAFTHGAWGATENGRRLGDALVIPITKDHGGTVQSGQRIQRSEKDNSGVAIIFRKPAYLGVAEFSE